MKQLDDLASVAWRTLPLMLNAETGLFSHKTTVVNGVLANARDDALYSAACLVGFAESERAGIATVEERVDFRFALDSVRQVAIRSTHGSLIGATLWAVAAAEDRGTDGLLRRVRTLNPQSLSSMDIGLCLSGVAAASRIPAHRDEALAAGRRLSDELLGRFSTSGRVFRGMAHPRSLSSLALSRVTSFASQVYPVHGLIRHAAAAGDPVPRPAVAAGELLVERQGALGQWPWFYDLPSGRVLEAYPVYGVHQDAMAFMALAALQNAGAGNFGPALAKGLDWVFGANELGTSLVDREHGLIYRCIQRRGSDPDGFGGIGASIKRRLWAASICGTTLREPRPAELEILYECRSYHLGWILYARSLVREWSSGS